MQIPPSHHLLHALGSTPLPPEPVRSTAATVTPEPVAPGGDVAPPPPQPPRPGAAPDGLSATPAPGRPGSRINLLV